ncbi:FxSxx-COOH system tetratricopeptide repeat protein [Micromonospora echinofusca]|uniref:FxSxx-COOH system tetratricopeptide repeat protein n=1 Tax=Micromonospora echinofusca TaxID=47858 RepID=UPI0033C35202
MAEAFQGHTSADKLAGHLPPVTQRVHTEGHGTSALVGTGVQVNISTTGLPAPQLASDQAAPPAEEGPRLQVWNLRPRDRSFAGRGAELAELRARLSSGGAAAVQAVHGIGGVGKTQLILEYAYRHRVDYDVVWWISAEQPGLIGEQFSALGTALGVLDAGADSTIAQSKVRDFLGNRARWLLLFDNAEKPEDLHLWLPDGAGHVLITSRARNWGEVAQSVELNLLPRDEAVELLAVRLANISAVEANRIAEDLGDLPLALAQAASYLAESGMSTADYRQALQEETVGVLNEGRPGRYPHSLAAATLLNASALGAKDPAALAVLHLCAFLAPEPIPTDLVVTIAAHVDLHLDAIAPLAQIIDKPFQRQRSISAVGALGLARVELGTITVHRLVQAVLRTQIGPVIAAELRTCIEAALSTVNPGDPRDSANWPRWSVVLPHLLAANPAHTENPALRKRARDAIVYLICRGDTRPAQQLAETLHQEWKQRLGPDHIDTLRAATELTWAYRDLGQLHRLYPLVDDTLTRQIKTLGYDHPDTLRTASDLAVVYSALGNHQRAREIDEDVHRRRVRVLGEDHPDTLTSAINLSGTLSDVGEFVRALEVAEDAHRRRVRVSGEDHPDTLTSGINLSGGLGGVGEFVRALEVAEDVYRRRVRVLGEDHPDTLTSGINLSGALGGVGEFVRALEVAEDVYRRRVRVSGEDHPDTLTSALNLSGVLSGVGEFVRALEVAEDVHRRRVRVLGEDHPDTLTSGINLSGGLGGVGEFGRALEVAEDVYRRRVRVSGADHPKTLMVIVDLAQLLLQHRRMIPARRYAEQAHQKLRTSLGSQHPSTKRARSTLDKIVAAMGGRQPQRNARRRP